MRISEQDLHQVRRWRERQAVKTAGAGIAAQAVSYGIRAAVIPISLKLLGVERYGLWLAIGSMVAWGGLADLGLSEGLVNVIAKSSGERDVAEMRRHVSTALVAYAFIATVLAIIAVLVANWPGLPRLLGTGSSTVLAGDAHLLTAVCGVVFALTIWFQSFSSICCGLQEGYLGSLPLLTGRIVGLIPLGLLFWRGTSVLAYALIILLPPLAAQLGLGIFLFGWRHPELRPSLRLCNRRSLCMLFAIGGPMAMDQVASIGILYSANVLVANRLTAAMVPRYAIPYSLFAIVNGAAYLIADSHTPAYAEATGSKDWSWIHRRAVRCLFTTMALVVCANIALIVVGRGVIAFWAGQAMVPSFGFLLALASFGLFRTYSETNGVLLVGLGLVKTKAALQLAVATAIVVGGWFLLPSLGLAAIPILGSIGCGLSGALALPYAVRELHKKEADAGSLSLDTQRLLRHAVGVE